MKNVVKIQENSLPNILQEKNEKDSKKIYSELSSNRNQLEMTEETEQNESNIPHVEDEEYQDPPPDLSKERNFGNTFPFLFIKGEPLFILGPDLRNFLVTFIIATFLSFLILCLKIYLRRSCYIILSYSIIYFSFFVSYLLAAFMNPGVPKNKNDFLKNKKNEINLYRQCDRCFCIIYKNADFLTFHCNECDLCVEDFDHHCPFITKCVGRKNKKFFNMFLGSLVVLIISDFVYIFI